MGNRANQQRRDRNGQFADEGKRAVSAPTMLAAGHDDEPDEWLRKAQKVEYPSEAYALATDPNCSSEALSVVSDFDLGSRRSEAGDKITSHHNTEEETLMLYAVADRSDAHAAMAWNNPSTPSEALREITKNNWQEAEVFKGAFLHPNCPVDLIVKHATGDDELLREYALQSELCPAEIRADAAANDEDEDCREAATNDPVSWKDISWGDGPIGFDDTVKSATINERHAD